MHNGPTTDGRQQSHWHMSKEFSIGTAVGLLINLIVLTTFAVRMDTRIEWLERQDVSDRRVALIEANAENAREAVLALENRTLQSLNDIKEALRRIEERQNNNHKDSPTVSAL